jgi:signal transduction histidine kinase
MKPTRGESGQTASELRSLAVRELTDLVLSSTDYESALTAVSRLALPDFGAWSVVDVIEPPDSVRRLAVIHPDPEKQRLARTLPEGWPPETEDPIGVPAVMSTRQPHIVRHMTDEMLVGFARNEETLAVLRELGIGSFLVVPLIARDEVLGAVTFVTPSTGYQYTERDLGEAEELAALIALVIHNATLHRDLERARDRADQRAEEAQRQHRDLEQIMEVQARLVRGFSHDVKNPLGAAVGYADLLEAGLMGALTAQQKESMARISVSIRTALELIDDLVAYASSRMGKVDVQPGPADVREIAREIAEEYRAQVEAAGLELQVDLDDEIPRIRSDRIRVRQILGNLLSNAVKYTDEGRVTVRVERRRDGAALPGEESIALAIADTGPGIPAEKQQLLFQEFARLDPSASAGGGLGLAISRSIADALGGRLALDSTPGEGSTFTLWLPLIPADEE